ncbi:hypothetical protein PR202_gb15151 [Eleusine coracana subsp. coracana]|uniref:Uncharacterized protein n=1 Tax=Eleusine coracana subsp. coracana TaxID=191504 RepID=A0AAV5EWV7_ELECO|nr:hypothetical protein PR202_gb15151 [Eleusine coracana subsp. coracana]
MQVQWHRYWGSGDQTGMSFVLAVVSKGSAAVVSDGGLESVPARRLEPGGDGGGHDEHVAERGDPPLVYGVVVGAELHLALARRHLHQVRRAVVVARLLRRARLHVLHDACKQEAGQLGLAPCGEENRGGRDDRSFGCCGMLTFFGVREGHDQVRLLDPEYDLAALVRRRGHRVQLPFPVRHRDEHVVALGQRRTGPRVVKVEVEVVL